MYTDEYEERGYPIRSFIIKFIIIVIIILLLIWLLPKFIKPKNTNKPVVTKESKVKEEEVYQNNTDSMQKAAFKYYDKDNLPKENGKYKQVTLQELIDEDYIEPLKDQNGKKINTSKSYLKLTKVDEKGLSKNVRGLVRKLNRYVEFLKNNNEFQTSFYDLGDGVSISRRIKDEK